MPVVKTALRSGAMRFVVGVLTLYGVIQLARVLPHVGPPSLQTLLGASCFMAGAGWLLRHRD